MMYKLVKMTEAEVAGLKRSITGKLGLNKISSENDKTEYAPWFGKRSVFYEGRYVGWYRPNAR